MKSPYNFQGHIVSGFDHRNEVLLLEGGIMCERFLHGVRKTMAQIWEQTMRDYPFRLSLDLMAYFVKDGAQIPVVMFYGGYEVGDEFYMYSRTDNGYSRNTYWRLKISDVIRLSI